MVFWENLKYLGHFAFFRLVKPIFSRIKQGFLFVGQTVQKVVNSVLLSVVYFIGIGITSIIGKIFRKKFLFLQGKKESYWDENKLGKETLDEGRRLF